METLSGVVVWRCGRRADSCIDLKRRLQRPWAPRYNTSLKRRMEVFEAVVARYDQMYVEQNVHGVSVHNVGSAWMRFNSASCGDVGPR